MFKFSFMIAHVRYTPQNLLWYNRLWKLLVLNKLFTDIAAYLKLMLHLWII